MVDNDFIALTNWILEGNTYFDAGYANVYLDELSGYIVNMDTDERFAAGIDDRMGSYFYIRTDADIRYAPSRPALSDSTRSIDETVKCYLVAVVDNCDPRRLVKCLLNSLMLYGEERIRPLRSIYIREVAMAKELGKVDKEIVKESLSRLGSLQVVTIEFELTVKFTPADCGCNPCKTCADE